MPSTFAPQLQTSATTDSFPNQELAALISTASAVSFDFFDTLVCTAIANPEDAFDLLGKRFDISDFRELRRAAQTEAFRRMNVAGRREISLVDIYDCMPEGTVPTSDLMQAEYDLELALLRPNPDVFALFLNLLSTGKKVVITSDMYLPVEFFADALRPHGLDQVRCFISANENATKRDEGALFDVVQAELGLMPENILHIGDNQLADVVRAREKRMMAYHYQCQRTPPVGKNAALLTSVGYGMLCHDAQDIPIDSYAELGFVYGGNANFGFLEWIKRQARLDGIDQLLFLSRDGYVLQRMVTEHAIDGLPDSCYFMGSRTAFTLSAMDAENFEKYMPFLLSGANGLAPSEVLERIGVQPPSLKIMTDLGLGRETRVDPSNLDHMKKFFFAYRREILKVCQRNRRGLFQYLREVGLRPGSRIAIVDVGWNGTTQEAFEAAVRPLMDIDVVGYYFCLANTPERLSRSSKQTMTAFVNEDNTSAAVVATVYANRVAIEQFFSAPHDSVIGYEVGSQGVTPVMDAGRGDTASLQDISTEVCAGAVAFAKHLKAFPHISRIHPTPLEWISPLIELLNDTKSKPYQLLCNVKNFDAWGSSKNHVLSLQQYLQH